MSILFHGRLFKYSGSIPEVCEEEIHIFSSGRSKMEMVQMMEMHDIQIPDGYKHDDVAKMYTQYSFLKSKEEFSIIAGIAEK